MSGQARVIHVAVLHSAARTTLERFWAISPIHALAQACATFPKAESFRVTRKRGISAHCLELSELVA